jgi:hypothetical protein
LSRPSPSAGSSTDPPTDRLPQRRVSRTVLVVLSVGIVVVAGTGIAVWLHGSSRTVRSTVGPGPVAGTVVVGRVTTLLEQQGSCAGHSEPQTLVRLVQPLHINAATVCTNGTSAGQIIRRSTANANNFDALSAALARADISGSKGDCTTNVPIVVSFAVEVSGRIVRPAMPLDRCGFPQNLAMSSLQTVMSQGSG